MKRPISAKLGILIGILLALLLIVGITAYFQIAHTNKKVQEIADVEHRTSETAYQMKINLMETGSAVLKYMHNSTASSVEVIRKGEERFSEFRNSFLALRQTDQTQKLAAQMEASHNSFKSLADSLVHLQGDQNKSLQQLRNEFTRLDQELEQETYVPEKRFDAHKDLKMRASFRIQEMKVSLNRLLNGVERYLKTDSSIYEGVIAESRKDFINSFEKQQAVARPEKKERFSKKINTSFPVITSLAEDVLVKQKQKQAALLSFEQAQRDFSRVLEEQVLVMANQNLLRSKEEALQTSDRSVLIIASLVLITLLFGTVTAVIFSRGITAPLKRLVAATRLIGKTDFSARVRVRSGDELEVLADSFNSMATQLQAAKEEQEKLMREVEKSNRELADFAHVVAHDLKAPLRGIHTLSEWLAQSTAGKLDKDEVEQIGLLRGGVRRMFALIDGILKFARIGRTQEKKEAIPLVPFLEELIILLAVPKHIHIDLAPELPEIYFDRVRLGQVFQNLLSNAVKYMNKEEGVIRITCEREGKFWKISVSDNGPGIEERYLTTIFQLFRTVNPKDEKESTGVGLTIVQKIIDQAGGRIWAESVVGQGSVFHFTIPANNDVLQMQNAGVNFAEV